MTDRYCNAEHVCSALQKCKVKRLDALATYLGNPCSHSTKLQLISSTKYENSTFVQSKSFRSQLVRFASAGTLLVRSGRNGVRRGETIKPVMGEIGQQKRDQ